MNKLIPEYSIFKVIIYDAESLIVENYKQLFDIQRDFIKIDNYLIKGSNLVVESLNQFRIEVHGKIKEIIIE